VTNVFASNFFIVLIAEKDRCSIFLSSSTLSYLIFLALKDFVIATLRAKPSNNEIYQNGEI